MSENEPIDEPPQPCIDCGSKDAHLAPCPYASDIHDPRGDDTPVWLCDDCAYQRAMDI